MSSACTRASTCLQTKLIIRDCLHQIYINFILFCSSLHRRPDSVFHMCVDITTWRQRLGNSGIYSQKHPHHCSVGSFMRINVRYGTASLRLCAALTILLFMAGVEINPEPAVTCAELATMINNLTIQVAGLSAQVNVGFQQCNVKLDGLRTSKKANFMLSGIVLLPSQSDGAHIATLLRNELGIDTTVVHCTHLGKPSAYVNLPQLLLVTVSSDVDARTAIRSATKLHRSTDDHIRDNVYFNANLTPEQRKADYDLRTELKLRRAAGEQNLIIRDGRLVTK